MHLQNCRLLLQSEVSTAGALWRIAARLSQKRVAFLRWSTLALPDTKSMCEFLSARPTPPEKGGSVPRRPTSPTTKEGRRGPEQDCGSFVSFCGPRLRSSPLVRSLEDGNS